MIMHHRIIYKIKYKYNNVITCTLEIGKKFKLNPQGNVKAKQSAGFRVMSQLRFNRSDNLRCLRRSFCKCRDERENIFGTEY